MKFEVLFFDLDDTLYSSKNGLWEAIRFRMTRYMVEKLGIPEAQVSEMRRHYYITYGTTLRGLQRHNQVDAEEFLAYVHDLPLKDYLQPAPEIREMLARLPQAKWVFTNADQAHAMRVLAELELEGIFEGIVDVKAVRYACKPEPEAYRRAMAIAGQEDPSRCMFLDDSPRNLQPARRLGIYTVLVGTSRPDPAAHISINKLLDLPTALPELFNHHSAHY
jgi:putative hydrolase of the HAD superfamily